MAKNPQILGVSGELLDQAWVTAGPMIEKALKRTDADQYYSLDDVKRMIEKHQAQLWVVIDNDVPVAALITQILKYPKINVIEVLFAGGSRMNKWADLAWDTFKRYGKENHCTKIKSGGREGWTKVLTDKTVKNYSWESEIS